MMPLKIGFSPLYKIMLAAIIMLILVILLTSPSWASSTGSNSALPYESWLLSFQKSLTGPVAFSVALIGLVGCGATLIFLGGEINRFLRSMVYILLVMTLLVGANSVMTNFFNGADIGFEPVVTEPPIANQDIKQTSSSEEAKATNMQP